MAAAFGVALADGIFLRQRPGLTQDDTGSSSRLKEAQWPLEAWWGKRNRPDGAPGNGGHMDQNCSALFLRRLMPAKPSAPNVRKSGVEGSGTGVLKTR